MKRPALALTLAMLLVLPAGTGVAGPDPTGTLISANLEILDTIPSPGVFGARFDAAKKLMYVTGASGLTIYDITDPAVPALVGALPLPHFENEDVDFAGNILLISNDAAESTGILYVIDISNPALPLLKTAFPMGGVAGVGGPGHTASCVMKCRFAWVTDGAGIMVIDLLDPATPVIKGSFATPAGGGLVTHDVQVDPNGLAWISGFGGAAAYRLPRDYASNPLKPLLVAKTGPEGMSTYLEELGLGDGEKYNDYILHNSMRRRNSDLLYVTEEDYTRPGCRGAGAFETWSVPVNGRGTPTGGNLKPLDKWVTELLADTASPAAQCSAHYFDLGANVIAQGWYEQGVRLLDVSKPGDLRQIGYFVPPSALTWAAHFPPTDPERRIIYVLDASHGIDILEFDRPDIGPLSAPRDACPSTTACRAARPRTVRAPIRPEWLSRSPAATSGVANGPFGYACRLSTDALSVIQG